MNIAPHTFATRQTSLWFIVLSFVFLGCLSSICQGQELTETERLVVAEFESKRIAAVEKAMPSVLAIYGNDRQGGGSGVVIHPSGLALTNHHVIMGAGVNGWAGLSDGNLYRWKLIGTDPGGDVALIKLEGLEAFPFSELGNSDHVRVGDWALAMGNPFILTEDQAPTVTLGIVSGVERYQPSSGDNQLVYGNCIQIDTSINPGNSGGPLFNLDAQVIGINGRISLLDRGRVNVGLGYAISANQIRNFLPDLLATKLVEHGTLDANFSDIGSQVICSTINELSQVSEANLTLGDRLLEFENIPIKSANHFTNLICTLPENWPVHLKIQKKDGRELELYVRLTGLPYSKPPRPNLPDNPTPEQKKQLERQLEIIDLLRAEPGTIRSQETNQLATQLIWRGICSNADSPDNAIQIVDQVRRDGNVVGHCETFLDLSGRMLVKWSLDDVEQTFIWDGEAYWMKSGDTPEQLTSTQAKLRLPIVQALGQITFNVRDSGLFNFGVYQLDGSDKSLRHACSRLKFLDQDDDWFFAWVSNPDLAPNNKTQLLKASAGLDSDIQTGAVVFRNWQQTVGWYLSNSRSFVYGLGETEFLELKTTNVSTLDAADFSAIFDRVKKEQE